MFAQIELLPVDVVIVIGGTSSSGIPAQIVGPIRLSDSVAVEKCDKAIVKSHFEYQLVNVIGIRDLEFSSRIKRAVFILSVGLNVGIEEPVVVRILVVADAERSWIPIPVIELWCSPIKTQVA